MVLKNVHNVPSDARDAKTILIASAVPVTIFYTTEAVIGSVQ